MDLFRRRPPITTPSSAELAQASEWAHGFCYRVRQDKLVFGSDRAEPVARRPAVSLSRLGSRYYVLPATSRRRSDFFHLRHEQWLPRKPPSSPPRDSYLCPRCEAVEQSDLKEIGILTHPVRIQIIRWLRDRQASRRQP